MQRPFNIYRDTADCFIIISESVKAALMHLVPENAESSNIMARS